MPVLRRLLSRPWIVLLFLGVFYVLLFQKYCAYDIDNAWFLSFSYNLCNEHLETDQFRQVRFPAGMDGTHLFGKLAAVAQAHHALHSFRSTQGINQQFVPGGLLTTAAT